MSGWVQDRIKAVLDERKHLDEPDSLTQRQRTNRNVNADMGDMVEKACPLGLLSAAPTPAAAAAACVQPGTDCCSSAATAVPACMLPVTP